jgi:hypothetical protein
LLHQYQAIVFAHVNPMCLCPPALTPFYHNNWLCEADQPRRDPTAHGVHGGYMLKAVSVPCPQTSSRKHTHPCAYTPYGTRFFDDDWTLQERESINNSLSTRQQTCEWARQHTRPSYPLLSAARGTVPIALAHPMLADLLVSCSYTRSPHTALQARGTCNTLCPVHSLGLGFSLNPNLNPKPKTARPSCPACPHLHA